MEKNERAEYSPSQRRGKKQLVVLAQLLHLASEMKHVDDMLAWLSNALVKQLDIQLVQFWTMQASSNAQVSVMLRAYAFEDASLPQHIFYNTHLIETMEKLFSARRGLAPGPVNHYFLLHQANLFQRYGLNYCFGYFLENSDLLPPPPGLASALATPFMMYVLLFTRATPATELTTATGQILAQVVPIAKQHGWLIAPTFYGPAGSVNLHSAQLSPALSLADLIPVNLKEKNAMRTTNPFASGPNLERRALHLYQAIDGRRSVAEIATLIRYNEKEMFDALKALIQQKLIEVHDISGRAVDISQFFSNYE